MDVTKAVLRFAYFFFMDILVMATLSEMFPERNLGQFWGNSTIIVITILTSVFYALKDWDK